MAPGRARDVQKERQWRRWISQWRASGFNDHAAVNLVGPAARHEHEAAWGAAPDAAGVEVGEPGGAGGVGAGRWGGEVGGRQGQQQSEHAGYPVGGSSGRGAPASNRERTPAAQPVVEEVDRLVTALWVLDGRGPTR